MARDGDELFNPATGLRTVFRQTAAETNGELLQVDWIAAGPWTTGPDHIHPLQDERFESSLPCSWRSYCAHFENEIYLARPPLAVQRVLPGAVAAVGRLLGYSPEYPYSSRFQTTGEPWGATGDEQRK